jgi:hypothetical protein
MSKGQKKKYLRGEFYAAKCKKKRPAVYFGGGASEPARKKKEKILPPETVERPHPYHQSLYKPRNISPHNFSNSVFWKKKIKHRHYKYKPKANPTPVETYAKKHIQDAEK